jgi:hypothetical protein
MTQVVKIVCEAASTLRATDPVVCSGKGRKRPKTASVLGV